MGVFSPSPSFLFFKREKWEGEVKLVVRHFLLLELVRLIQSVLLCPVVSLSVSCYFEWIMASPLAFLKLIFPGVDHAKVFTR